MELEIGWCSPFFPSLERASLDLLPLASSEVWWIEEENSPSALTDRVRRVGAASVA